MTNVSENYLRDLGFLLREQAFLAKERLDLSKGTASEQFESGRNMAYYEMLSLMLSQAKAFQIPISQLALQDIDPDRDLLG